jgi:muconolactone delta-isomerase
MMTPAEIDQLIERARKREQEHARRLQRRGASMSHSGEDHDW